MGFFWYQTISIYVIVVPAGYLFILPKLREKWESMVIGYFDGNHYGMMFLVTKPTPKPSHPLHLKCSKIIKIVHLKISGSVLALFSYCQLMALLGYIQFIDDSAMF